MDFWNHTKRGDNLDIRKYLEENILVTDGAMGTYYGEVTGNNGSSCEFANVENPDVVKKIHEEYISAGAKLIRTNTFYANPITTDIEREMLEALIKAGYRIAVEAAKDKDVFIGCSIGPLHEAVSKDEDLDVLDEYKFIADTFLSEGADIFVFETFGTLDYLKEISGYIKSKKEDAFILVQFAIAMDGHTRKGISVNKILAGLKQIDTIDAYGFNCGAGPTHIYKMLKELDIFDGIVSVLPNAGYPEVINDRMVYVNNPGYYSDIMVKIAKLGARIIGGCCGTTPEHIRNIVKKLNDEKSETLKVPEAKSAKKKEGEKAENGFLKKLMNDEFVLAVELDPPFDTDIASIMKNAKICKEIGIDVVTVADSPRAIARVDSLMMSSKIKRETGIDVMPHVCCRDKNLNALKSGLLAAHVDGIRNILVVTGDPVLGIDKVSTKGVFNLNSYELISLIDDMNSELFKDDPMLIGGALNLNVLNKEAQINRMVKKHSKGADVFLTQPIFEDEVIDYLPDIDRNSGKILAGIMPIVSYKNALFLNNEVPGITVPEDKIEMFKSANGKEESIEIGISIAVETIDKIRDRVDGIYFITPFNRIDIIKEIMDRVKLK